MKRKEFLLSCMLSFSVLSIQAQQYNATPVSLTIPDKLTTPIGTLDFKDGAPSAATVQKLYDNLDFLHAQNVFLNTFQGASTYAIGEGFKSIGADDNTFLIFSNLMDSKSLFLTANADVVYYVGMINLSKGPMVIETPPKNNKVESDLIFLNDFFLT